MNLSAKLCALEDIKAWRDLYRAEMRCQIVHDSLHARSGWAQPYIIEAAGVRFGYCSVLVGGPWCGTRTLFEFYLLPQYRNLVFAVFSMLLEATGATAVLAQTSDRWLSLMLQASCRDARSEKIVFEDGMSTSLPCYGSALRKIQEDDRPRIFEHHREPVGDYVLIAGDEIVATGGIAWHYNRPYGDIFLEVDGRFRRRGLGSYLVQELKRLCYENGGIPCVRCASDDVASISTIQKAGLVPVAHILTGSVAPRAK